MCRLSGHGVPSARVCFCEAIGHPFGLHSWMSNWASLPLRTSSCLDPQIVHLGILGLPISFFSVVVLWGQ